MQLSILGDICTFWKHSVPHITECHYTWHPREWRDSFLAVLSWMHFVLFPVHLAFSKVQNRINTISWQLPWSSLGQLYLNFFSQKSGLTTEPQILGALLCRQMSCIVSSLHLGHTVKEKAWSSLWLRQKWQIFCQWLSFKDHHSYVWQALVFSLRPKNNRIVKVPSTCEPWQKRRACMALPSSSKVTVVAN